VRDQLCPDSVGLGAAGTRLDRIVKPRVKHHWPYLTRGPQSVPKALRMNLNQVTLPSTDVAAATEFYRRLGLHLIVADLPTYVRFECPDGGSTLSIHLIEGRSAAPGAIIYFECDELDAVVDRLKREGVRIEDGPVDQPWLWREARLRDPDGNEICLYHAGKNRRNPPWRLRPPTAEGDA